VIGQCEICKKDDKKLTFIRIKANGKRAVMRHICDKCHGDYEDYVDREIMRRRGK